MAKRAGMTPTTYGRLEKGGHTRTERLQAIADAFFLPIEAVLQIAVEPAAGEAPTEVAKLRSEVAILRRELAALWDEAHTEKQPPLRKTSLEATERAAHAATEKHIQAMEAAEGRKVPVKKKRTRTK